MTSCTRKNFHFEKMSITIDVVDRDYKPADKMFSFECSDKDIGIPAKSIVLRNPKTGKGMCFTFVGADTDGEDTFGWRYKSVIGDYKLLIIND
jgi:hypothetical protein